MTTPPYIKFCSPFILAIASLLISGKAANRSAIPNTVFFAYGANCYVLVSDNLNPAFTTSLAGSDQAVIRTNNGTYAKLWADSHCSIVPVYFSP